MRNPLLTVLGFPASLLILTMQAYQHTLSPDHGPLKALYPHGFCRHQPTCSDYAISMLQTRSLPVALWLIGKRLLSCHPWARTEDGKLRTVIAKV